MLVSKCKGWPEIFSSSRAWKISSLRPHFLKKIPRQCRRRALAAHVLALSLQRKNPRAAHRIEQIQISQINARKMEIKGWLE